MAESDDKVKTVAYDGKDVSAAEGESGDIIVCDGKPIIALKSSNLRRDLNTLTLIAFGFNLSSSWAALSVTSIIAIAQGGSVTILYGVILVAVAYICTGLTLAELISVYPTAGGQYHFASILAPERLRKPISYISGFSSILSWIATSAGSYLIIAQLIIALVITFHGDYTPQSWHFFMIFEATNLFATVYNIFLLKRAPRIYDLAFLLSLAGCVIIPIVCLAKSKHKQSTHDVWTSFTNNTGWNDGICFITGLVTPAFAFGGLDSTMHLVEETKHPKKAVPRAICYTVGIGFITAFLFAIAMVYCMDDIEAILATPTQLPIFELWHRASGSLAAATAFLAILLANGLIVTIATVQTTSRLTWALGRDNAFFWSSSIAHIHPKLEVPIWAILGDGVVVAILGTLYLVSSTAFNSFLGCSAMLLQFSFSVPAALLLWQRRSEVFLPRDRAFRLSMPVGFFCNVVTILWTVFICIFFFFPASLPATPSTMNYAVVVVAIGVLIGFGNWFAHARKHFDGPFVYFTD